ncbi:MarR family winged helix-turn-helix transcriptional regulator [Streptococcus equinus]|uniref:MarR family winged helix-turn-helix transcriptional regulator n=1 Tax=Streptococcus equinus TaxID=1335 RepID=UPI0008CC0812|nr:MarR family transcriptional regulator [Streptococcus equinus]SEK23057.1 DNA-binding transcriptional regulator, MarR family [Streptococcus equinus]
MRDRDPFSQLRDFVNLMENRVHELGELHDVENLAGPQGLAVLYLRDNEDKEVFIKDIERKLKISKSVTSNLIKRMEKNGFIKVVPSEVDKRYKRVELTELGRAKTKDIDAFHAAVHKQIFDGISREELEISGHVFDRILKNLENKE